MLFCLLSLLFCCRCEAHFFAVVARAAVFFVAVVPGGVFAFFCCRCGGEFLFCFCRCGPRRFFLGPGTAMTAKKTRPRNDSKRKKAPPGTTAKKTRPRNESKTKTPRNDSQKATTAKQKHGAHFCFAVVEGTGVHSLTGCLGPCNKNNNIRQLQQTTKNTGSGQAEEAKFGLRFICGFRV